MFCPPIRVFLSGFLLGGVLLVPGLSPGTAALALGVLFPLLRQIDGLALDRFNRKAYLLRLLPLLLGVLTGLPLWGKLLWILLVQYPLAVYGALTGLLAAALCRQVGRLTKAVPFSPAVPAAGALALLPPLLLCAGCPDGLLPAGQSPYLTGVLLFCIGAASAGVMSLTGGFGTLATGALVPLICGAYESMLRGVGRLDLLQFLPLLAGAAVGFLFLTRPARWLRTRFPGWVAGTSLGLTASGVLLLSRKFLMHIPGASPVAVILAVFGCLLCLLPGLRTLRKNIHAPLKEVSP